jgi:hypothetical protein
MKLILVQIKTDNKAPIFNLTAGHCYLTKLLEEENQTQRKNTHKQQYL